MEDKKIINTLKRFCIALLLVFPILCIYLVNREFEITTTFYASLICLLFLFGIFILMASFELKSSALKWASIIWFFIITLAILFTNEIQKTNKEKADIMKRQHLKNVPQDYDRNYPNS